MPRIVTLTLNPALDISSGVESVVPNHKLRCSPPTYEPGGGGINVARVAKRLGCSVEAVVPLGGSAGQRVAKLVELEGIPLVQVPIQAETRESITIGATNTSDQYRFVFPGPEVTESELVDCERALAKAAVGATCVVISGSVPSNLPEHTLASMVASLAPTPVLIDTSSDALRLALQSGAYLVKPSARELASVVDRLLLTEAEIIDAARQVLRESTVSNLAVSIGAGGAVILGQDGRFLRVRAPTVKVTSTVGAGDSMVAGFAVGLDRGMDLSGSACLGVAAGTATVMTPGTNLCDPEQVESLLPLVSVEGDRSKPA